MMLVLNVGSGPAKNLIVPEGITWRDATEIRLDIEASAKPDVVGDLCHLPFADATFDGLVASHVLEHIRRDDCLVAGGEMYRVLRIGGEIYVRVPDMEWAARYILEHGMPIFIQGVVYGDPDKPSGGHLVGFDKSLLVGLMCIVGFKLEAMWTGHGACGIETECPGEPPEITRVPDLALKAIKGGKLGI